MPSRESARTANHRQRGVGLIEVLIAILVMSIGILGVAALQATALRNGQSSLERSVAVIQTYSIMDAMRANRDRAINGDYDLLMNTPCAMPTAGTLAKDDLIDWLHSLQAALGPSACGSIGRVGANGNIVVTVQWDDSRGSGGDSAQQLVTRTQL